MGWLLKVIYHYWYKNSILLVTQVYGCFVDFEKAFDSINSEALWLKMRKMSVSESIVSFVKLTYEDIKFCEQCGENQISNCAPHTKGLCEGSGLIAYLFSIFVNDVVWYIDTEGILELWFADDLAVVSILSYGIQKKI